MRTNLKQSLIFFKTMEIHASEPDTANKSNQIRKRWGIVFMVFLLILFPGVIEAQYGSNPESSESSESAEQQIETESELNAQDELGPFQRIRFDNQARTINRQRESLNINSALSHGQMENFGDYTIQQALIRVPGIQMDQRGIINMRGAGPHQYLVTVDGQHIGTTGAGDRSFNLSGIAIDMVRDVEVKKVTTPDMHADALAGTINLVTRHGYVENRNIHASTGGGTNYRYFGYTGFDRRGALQYNEPLVDDLSLSVNINHLGFLQGWESLQIGYDTFDFGEGSQQVVEQISPALHTDASSRLGGNIELMYHPSEQDNYYIRGFYNRNDQDQVRHRRNWLANGDWLRPDTTGREGEQGIERYELQFQDRQTQHVAVQAGGRHLLDFMELDYNAGWGQSSYRLNGFDFPFDLERSDFIINMDDPDRPIMQQTFWPTLEDERTVLPHRFFLQDVSHVIDEHIDNTFTARIDSEIPFGIGSLKLGSSARVTRKVGDYSSAGDYSYGLGRLSMWRFGVIRSRVRSIEVFDREVYEIPRLIDHEDARTFFETNEPFFDRDDMAHTLNSDIWNYTVWESIYSGYGMTTLEIGNFTILGGARVEHDIADNEGNLVTLNEDGELESDTESQSVGTTHLFPNAQLLYRPLEGTRFQFAYSKSVTRPDFNRIVPFERTNFQDSTLFRGNPQLEPTISNNLDASIEQYIGSTGVISVGVFQKDLSNFVFEIERTLEEGDRAGFMERTFENGEENATIYGAELTLQQHFTYLPGFLSNFGVFANYTWSQSEFDVDGGDNDEVRLPGHSPHVVNAALEYSQGRIFTQVMYHWTDEMPAIGQQGYPIVTNQTRQGWEELSASFRFRFSDNFRFWADAFGLLGGLEMRQTTPDGFITDFRGGQKFNIGIQFRL